MRYLKITLVFLLIIFNINCFASNSESSKEPNQSSVDLQIQEARRSINKEIDERFNEAKNRISSDFDKEWDTRLEGFKNKSKSFGELCNEVSNTIEKVDLTLDKKSNLEEASKDSKEKTLEEVDKKHNDHSEISFCILFLFAVLCFITHCLSGGDSGYKASSGGSRKMNDDFVGSGTVRWAYNRYYNRRR